jgi:hypothetical protein
MVEDLGAMGPAEAREVMIDLSASSGPERERHAKDQVRVALVTLRKLFVVKEETC